MRRLQRLPLSPEALEFLQGRARAVIGSADPKAEAERLWKLQTAKAFLEIRATLGRMASGLGLCMYCDCSESTNIEHFWPKSKYPERAFYWENYLFACSRCNSNFKRNQFPLDDGGNPLLINPTEEEPLDHLNFVTSTGKYAARTSKGEASRVIFGLNRTLLHIGRLNAWRNIRHLVLPRYAQLRAQGKDNEAELVVGVLKGAPFSGVLAAFLKLADGPAAERLIGQECLAVLRAHPEIRTWL